MNDNHDLSDERLREVAEYSASKWAADAAKEILRLREQLQAIDEFCRDVIKDEYHDGYEEACVVVFEFIHGKGARP